MSAASVASAAVVAAAAVNAAVGMRTLSAPDSEKSYVYRDGAALQRSGQVDEAGLPLIYDKELIQLYWKKQGSALTQRWAEFLGYAIPFLTRVVTILVSGGSEELKNNGASLARDARIIFEKLGPTYVKLGQMMSVRPDVLPPEALAELKALQDSVKPFDSATAIRQIESELGGPLGAFFSEISQEPVAAASLAQVYKARLAGSGELVAVKIQRPAVLEVVSKDLYVLRRAAEVYQGLIERFAPQQRTNYVALLNEWAVGFYTELDFLNEAANQQKLKELMTSEGVTGIYIPQVFPALCTRRVLVSEWVDGAKLSDLEPRVLGELIPAAQEAFLTQLLQVGFFHADPHPGNMLYMSEPRGPARIALIDFGLVASIEQEDRDTMVAALIHLANRDYPSLVDDFIGLGILPADCDRAKVVPLMDKALTPYVKGGGAKQYEQELKKLYGMDGSLSGTAGGFQAMTNDALTVLNDIPFSIPPYFALLARAIVTLEGLALTGNPSYGIVTESYPFVARKLLREDRPEIQKALQQLLYSTDKGPGEGMVGGLRATRLTVLLNSALGVVKKTGGGTALVDLDSLPEGAVGVGAGMRFLLADNARSLRALLLEEAVTAADILLRQASRKAFQQLVTRLSSPSMPTLPFFGRLPSPLPKMDLQAIPVPFLVPRTASPNSARGPPVPVFSSPRGVLELLSPPLSREETLYALALADLCSQALGRDASTLLRGDLLLEPQALARLVLQLGQIQSHSSSSNSLLSSLLGPQQGFRANAARLLRALARPNPATSSVSSVSAASPDPQGLEELAVALRDLNPAEQTVFRDFLSQLTRRLADSAIARLQPLLKA